MRLFRSLIVCLCCVLSIGTQTFAREVDPLFGDTIDRTAEDFVKVNLVVCDPDEVLYSTLGHAALRLECPTFGLDYVFSYESENVRDKIWTFLKGDLKMGMFAIPTEEFLENYRESGRGVCEYTINLTPAQEQRLWKVMDNHVTEGANLPYDYFKRGCAKSVVQVMHEAVGRNGIRYAPWSDKYTKKTMRELGCEFVKDAPWEEFISYFLLGTMVDKKVPCEQKLIIPTDLVEVWQQATFENGKKVLDSECRVLLKATKHNEGTWFTPLLVSIILLILALGSMISLWGKVPGMEITATIVNYSVLVIVTVLGITMTYLICFSSLPCTTWNWLIIPFNVLPAIGWYWRKYWALPWAIVLSIWCAVMAGEWIWGHILVDWAHIILTIIFVLILIKNK